MALISVIKKLIPKAAISRYHKAMSFLADRFYGHPSGKMTVIGVSGTKGKSTTCYFIAKILEDAGFRVGMTSTAMFKIAEREWLNPYKMTMRGRFAMHGFLQQMVRAGCRYAIVETSSEGIAQYRHAGIEYDAAVFTNIAPEHIEAHGSFEKYLEVKTKLFSGLKKRAGCSLLKDKKVIVVNGDDAHVERFTDFPADVYYRYGASVFNKPQSEAIFNDVLAEDIQSGADGSSFRVGNVPFQLHLLGAFNIQNALAAIAVAQSQGIDLEICRRALDKILVMPGRMESIEEGQDFRVIVDYAHNPSSFAALYETLLRIPHGRVFHIFGGTGGGRDKLKRPEMGRMAAKNVDVVIVTTDDPYRDDPKGLAEEVWNGMEECKMKNATAVGGGPPEGGIKCTVNMRDSKIILDRKDAIAEAVRQARTGDIVLITGKGCEQKMAIGDRMIPWDDRKVARDILRARKKF